MKCPICGTDVPPNRRKRLVKVGIFTAVSAIIVALIVLLAYNSSLPRYSDVFARVDNDLSFTVFQDQNGTGGTVSVYGMINNTNDHKVEAYVFIDLNDSQMHQSFSENIGWIPAGASVPFEWAHHFAALDVKNVTIYLGASGSTLL